MSNFDSDASFEGDWDEKGGLVWNEFDWKEYLREHDREIARFLTIYNSLKDQPDHLDETARQMGWELDDWSVSLDGDDDPLAPVDMEGEMPPDEADFEDADPYTLHKHPVYIVTRALHEYLRRSWEHFMLQIQQNMPAQLAWTFANSLHRSELFSILALQSLDLGDFALAVCHLKTALTALNQAMSALQRLTHRNPRFLTLFRHEMMIRIFDLREVWLRVIHDCREEVRRRNSQ